MVTLLSMNWFRSYLANNRVNQSVSRSISQSVNQSTCQSVRKQDIDSSQSVSQSISHLVLHSVTSSIHQWDNQLVGLSVTEWTYDSNHPLVCYVELPIFNYIIILTFPCSFLSFLFLVMFCRVHTWYKIGTNLWHSVLKSCRSRGAIHQHFFFIDIFLVF